MRLPRTLLGRSVLLTCSVAAAAVLVAAITAYPLIRSTVIAREQALLSRVADLTAAALELEGDRATIILPARLQRRLVEGQVSGYLLTSSAKLPDGLTANQAEAALRGSQVSAVGSSAGGPILVEARPVGPGIALVLIQPIDVILPAARQALLQVAAALLLGLAVAMALGVLAARRLARPLAAMRQAALRMNAGERDVRLPARGPIEVRDIADALNQLDATLIASEGRQREFLLSISHELRTPLTGIRGYAEAMSDGLIEANEIPRVGTRLTAETQRLGRLIDDLLVLARLEALDFPLDMAEVDLGELLAEAVDSWQAPCAAAGISIVGPVDSDGCVVRTDPIRVRQLLDNLIENAVRVSPSETVITLWITVPGLDEREASRAAATAGFATVGVDDQGPGLADADLSRAFEPGTLYSTYRGVRPVGTGLGLAIVGRLARRLGGAAQACPGSDGGASFRLHLPLSVPAVVPATAGRGPVHPRLSSPAS